MKDLKEIFDNNKRPVFDECGDSMPTLLFEDFIDAIAEYEQSKWISVEERLPEFDEQVIVWCAIHGRYLATYVFIGEFDGIKYGNWHDGKNLGVLPPKFWQPLPTPPKP